MNLKHLTDTQLLLDVKTLVNNERKLLTQVLHHLREVVRRRLFSALGYKSLFEYALKELGYSEGQVCRRIQAMRLIKELPEFEKEIENKISTGALSLNNISRASSFFKEAKKQAQTVNKAQVLQSLENKSSKEGERLLLSLLPSKPLPKEKAMVVSPKHTELNFLADESLLGQLEEVRSLLGSKGASMSLAELVAYMCKLTSHELKVKRFGKKRVENAVAVSEVKANAKTELGSKAKVNESKSSTKVNLSSEDQIYPYDGGKKLKENGVNKSSQRHKYIDNGEEKENAKKKSFSSSQSSRLISKGLKHDVWLRDQGKCVGCGGKRGLQYDHIKPVALGGGATFKNLRLLCFSCNQRRGIEQNLVALRG